jgi:hypothetical protein
VFRAADDVLQREVALKRIGLGPDGDAARAAREAQAAARLAHPAIVALYEAWAAGEDFYLISELVEGTTLAELIRDDALADDEILEIGVALCAALSHAHGRGVVHRDIKPQNVLVPSRPQSTAGAAKLTDFGGAALAGEDVLTRTGDVLGTLAYMAPEQSDGRPAGPRADLYSLALVLYEALSGSNPIRGATPAETARRIGRRIRPLERERSDLPRALTRALDRALAAAPHERGEVTDLEVALAGALNQHARRESLVPRRPRAQAAMTEPVIEATAEQSPEVALENRARLLVPRGAWLALAAALIAWQGLVGRPGVALVLAAALAPLLALPRRSAPWCLAAVLAPALGLVGLAGAFPAGAGQAARWQVRAALAALGYWWLTLAAPVLGRTLWLAAAAGAAPRGHWQGSLAGGAHVLARVATEGTALGVAVWALAAAALPLAVRGRGAIGDLLAAAAWAGGLALASVRLDSGLGAAPHSWPHGLVAGALLGVAIAVAARALRGTV